MRGLAVLGVLTEGEVGFGLTPLGESLLKDVPGSLYTPVIMEGGLFYRTWEGLEHTVRTGETAFNQIYGQGFFEPLVGQLT